MTPEIGKPRETDFIPIKLENILSDKEKNKHAKKLLHE